MLYRHRLEKKGPLDQTVSKLLIQYLKYIAQCKFIQSKSVERASSIQTKHVLTMTSARKSLQTSSVPDTLRVRMVLRVLITLAGTHVFAATDSKLT